MNTQQIKGFILAGNALFTLKSLRTGNHFTFLVQQQVYHSIAHGKSLPVSPAAWNVKVLNGRDNSKDYHRIGVIYADEDFVRAGGIGNSQSLSIRGFDWFWTKLRLGSIDKLTQAQFAHAGRCGRCGRLLTHPESIASGIGPECQDKMAFESQGGTQGLLDQLFGG